MVGLRKSWIRRQRSTYMTCSWWNLPSGVSRMATHVVGRPRLPTSAFRSCPELKCLPAPARITTRTSSSASARSKAASSASMSALFWALATSGRFMRDGRHRPVDLVAHHRLSARHGRPPSPSRWASSGRRHCVLGAAGRARGAGRAPVRRSRCAGSRSCRRRSTPPDSRARPAATIRPRDCPSASRHSGAAGPSTSRASACRRLLISLQ